MKKRQKGLSYFGMFLVALCIVFVGLFVIKVVPAYIEYFGLVKIINSIAKSGELRGASPMDIRNSFAKRLQIDYVNVIQPSELEVKREGPNMVVGFSYKKQIPLFANISLLIDFESYASGDAQMR